jgi:Tfp pilus tip-associated adhesin PilY1
MIMPGKIILIIIAILFTASSAGVVRAADEVLWTTVTTPDALIILDRSYSMDFEPSDNGTGNTGSNYWAANTDCTGTMSGAPTNWATGQSYALNAIRANGPQSYKCILAHTSSAANKPREGASWATYWAVYGARCRKIDIAKYALFKLLDANSDNVINAADVSALGIRLGLMRFYNTMTNGNNTASKVYTDSDSAIQLSWGITQADNTTTTPYANLFCNNTTCSPPVTTAAMTCTVTSPVKECFTGYDADNSTNPSTPIQYSLREAQRYLDAHKLLDNSATCRQKSVIIITDGADTVACSSGSASNKTRHASVYQAKVLADAHYKVYVIGFGSTMPAVDQRTLNWMAYYGQTRNPNATQSVVPSGFTLGTAACSPGSDPGSFALDGYAFIASTPADLAAALKTAITSIQEANYSFSSQASVAAARTSAENFIYEASFEPKNDAGVSKEPFWTGHLRKYSINTSGGLITPPNWDAGAKLRDTTAGNRHMWTYKGATANALVSFDTSHIFDADLGLGASTTSCSTSGTSTDHNCTSVVGFYRGDSYNLEGWKLGDLFHTNPMVVSTPTQFFYDPRECGATSFATFRSNNPRSSASGTQLILAGANDGQLHAFRTGNSATDATAGGDEVWSFIPPNLLQKMAPIAHSIHPTDRSGLASHSYFIDGPIQVASVWLPATAGSGASKTCSSSLTDPTVCDWKTIAVFGEGQGSGSYLWSNSSSCYSASTSGFSATYSPNATDSSLNYVNYCGLYALDVTKTLSATIPKYLWKLNALTPAAAPAGPYLGEAWSKMQIGRVRIGGNEKWVGFIGGGYNASTCLSADGATSTACNTPATGSAGKGFFVVDLTNGNILWSFTHADNANMDFSAPASPLAMDLDADGFVDTVYMGDLGGNMWRFRLCPKDTYCSSCGLSSYTSSSCDTSCTTANWSGSLLFQSTNIERGSGLSTPSNTHKQIFTAATATRDAAGKLWIYFGTGENNDPTWKPPTTPTAIPDTVNTKNRLYGIKEDPSFAATYAASNLSDITSDATYDATTATTHGWYINLSTNTLTRSDNSTITSPVGEKMISDPTVFGGVVYFSTYVPDQGTGSACGLAGDAFLYGIRYMSGSGAFDSGSRAKYIGHGIGSSPIISMGPGGGTADIYATASGGAGTGALTQKVAGAPTTSSMTNILYWKDKRLQ